MPPFYPAAALERMPRDVRDDMALAPAVDRVVRELCAPEPFLPEQVRVLFVLGDNALAAALRAGLQTLPHVQAVTGLGLMVGVAFADGVSAAAVRTACERQGLLVLTAKTRLRLLPPLILTQEDVDKALAILRSVLESL